MPGELENSYINQILEYLRKGENPEVIFRRFMGEFATESNTVVSKNPMFQQSAYAEAVKQITDQLDPFDETISAEGKGRSAATTELKVESKLSDKTTQQFRNALKTAVKLLPEIFNPEAKDKETNKFIAFLRVYFTFFNMVQDNSGNILATVYSLEDTVMDQLLLPNFWQQRLTRRPELDSLIDQLNEEKTLDASVKELGEVLLSLTQNQINSIVKKLADKPTGSDLLRRLFSKFNLYGEPALKDDLYIFTNQLLKRELFSYSFDYSIVNLLIKNLGNLGEQQLKVLAAKLVEFWNQSQTEPSKGIGNLEIFFIISWNTKLARYLPTQTKNAINDKFLKEGTLKNAEYFLPMVKSLTSDDAAAMAEKILAKLDEIVSDSLFKELLTRIAPTQRAELIKKLEEKLNAPGAKKEGALKLVQVLISASTKPEEMAKRFFPVVFASLEEKNYGVKDAAHATIVQMAKHLDPELKKEKIKFLLVNADKNPFYFAALMTLGTGIAEFHKDIKAVVLPILTENPKKWPLLSAENWQNVFTYFQDGELFELIKKLAEKKLLDQVEGQFWVGLKKLANKKELVKIVDFILPYLKTEIDSHGAQNRDLFFLYRKLLPIIPPEKQLHYDEPPPSVKQLLDEFHVFSQVKKPDPNQNHKMYMKLFEGGLPMFLPYLPVKTLFEISQMLCDYFENKDPISMLLLTQSILFLDELAPRLNYWQQTASLSHVDQLLQRDIPDDFAVYKLKGLHKNLQALQQNQVNNFLYATLSQTLDELSVTPPAKPIVGKYYLPGQSQP